MAKRSYFTAGKRDREQAKREKRERKREKRAAAAEDRSTHVAAAATDPPGTVATVDAWPDA